MQLHEKLAVTGQFFSSVDVQYIDSSLNTCSLPAVENVIILIPLLIIVSFLRSRFLFPYICHVINS